MDNCQLLEQRLPAFIWDEPERPTHKPFTKKFPEMEHAAKVAFNHVLEISFLQRHWKSSLCI